jgi:uncharacterized membrane protein YhaH (DUF805 family)
MNWYLSVLKNYAGFSGRARRKEYWMFTLINVIVAIVLEVIALASKNTAASIVYYLYALAVLIPSIAVLVRRLHDIGKSGAWFWIGLIPIIGGIWLLVLTVTAGNSGPNRYGADPKAINALMS